MAKGKTKQKQESSWKRKRWFQIVAPEIFNNTVLGECPVLEADEMVGKCVKLSMMTLIGDIKRQNTNVSFRVVKTQDNKAFTEVIGFELLSSSIKRFVRRRRDRVDLSFVCKTKDGRAVRLKPFLITAYNASGSVKTALRKALLQLLVREVSALDYKHLVQLLVSGQLERKMRDVLRKIFPLKMAPIRVFELVDEKKVKVIEVRGGKQERVESEDVSGESVVIEDSENVSGESVVMEEAPVEEAPVEEAPVDEAPVEEAPVDEEPVEPQSE